MNINRNQARQLSQGLTSLSSQLRALQHAMSLIPQGNHSPAQNTAISNLNRFQSSLQSQASRGGGGIRASGGRRNTQVIRTPAGWAFADSPGVTMPAAMVRNYLTPQQQASLTPQERNLIAYTEANVVQGDNNQQGNATGGGQGADGQYGQQNQDLNQYANDIQDDGSAGQYGQYFMQNQNQIPGYPSQYNNQYGGYGTGYGAQQNQQIMPVGSSAPRINPVNTSPHFEDYIAQQDINTFPLANLNIRNGGTRLAPTVDGFGSTSFGPSNDTNAVKYQTKKVMTESMLFNSDEFLQAKEAVVKAQNKIDKIDEDIEGVRQDIVNETKGRANRSYIDAMVITRTNTLMRAKRAAQREYNAATAHLKGLTEAYKMKLQASRDANKQYMDKLKMVLDYQYKQNNYKLDLAKTIATISDKLPEGQSIQVGGYTIKGHGRSSDYQLFKVTSPSGAVHIVKMNKRTGAMERYNTGLTERVPGSQSGSSTSKMVRVNPAQVRKLVPDDKLRAMAEALGYQNMFGWTTENNVNEMLHNSDLSVVKDKTGSTFLRIMPYTEMSKGKKANYQMIPVSLNSK